MLSLLQVLLPFVLSMIRYEWLLAAKSFWGKVDGCRTNAGQTEKMRNMIVHVYSERAADKLVKNWRWEENKLNHCSRGIGGGSGGAGLPCGIPESATRLMMRIQVVIVHPQATTSIGAGCLKTLTTIPKLCDLAMSSTHWPAPPPPRSD